MHLAAKGRCRRELRHQTEQRAAFYLSGRGRGERGVLQAFDFFVSRDSQLPVLIVI